MKTRFLIFSFALIVSMLTMSAKNEIYVNPFIGTDGTGHTFPGPSMPFGLVQPGPDCKDTDWDYTSGYQYKDSNVIGFSQTHLSGTGIGEFGDILIMPFVNSWQNNKLIKSSEESRVGYYKVMKSDSVKVELTCTERVAFHRYTFPSEKAQLYIDLNHGIRFLTDSLVLDSDVRIVGKNRIEGTCHTKNWVERKYSFVILFNKPFQNIKQLHRLPKSNAPRYVLNFGLGKSNHTLQTKIALSTTSAQGAFSNLMKEIPHWDFENTYKRAIDKWANYLDRIDVETDSINKVKFYTSLYHLLLQPSNIADVDGAYRGVDGNVSVAKSGCYYSTLSTWDIYRAAFPLLQIIAPEKINGIIQSMIEHHRQAGFLPIWTAWGNDNYCMIGNHSIPMIVSAYKNGFKGFSPDDAFNSIYETSKRTHIHSDWDVYTKYGYYPYDIVKDESVSKALENGYDDWCVSEFAQLMGKNKVAEEFSSRSSFYKNLYDPESHLLRGRDSKGEWRSPFDPYTATSPMNNPGDYTEANAWQYFWTPAQHDIDGVTTMLGGIVELTSHLDTFFETLAINPNKYLGQEAMIGQYAHGNEPCHHIVYLYSYSNTPWKGQRLIHQIVNEFYGSEPDGMIGNDDCGQMSAWYVLSCMGFYSVNPASGLFVLGSPQFKRITIKHGNSAFVINAKNIDEANFCVKRALLNNKPVTKTISYKEIMKQGCLEFEMMPYPSDISKEKYKQLPFGDIKPKGWIADQMNYDLNGIIMNLPKMIPDLLNDPIYSTGRLTSKSVVKDLGNIKDGDSEGDEQYKWWNSETQSNWSDALIRNSILLNDAESMEFVKLLVEKILQTQDKDGYMGIYSPELRYKTGKENGELWSKTTLFRGLLAYYEYSRNSDVLKAIEKAVENVLHNWPIHSSHPFEAGRDYNGGVAHGLTFTDVLDKLYQLTGNTIYREYALFLYSDYCANYMSEKDAQISNILNPNYKCSCHGVHTYEHIRPLIVAAFTSSSSHIRSALDKYLDKVSRLVSPSGGAVGDEWISTEYADSESTGYEYCSLHELLDSYSVLLQKRGDVVAAEKIENIYYNAAQGSRNPLHPAIAYLKTDNSFEMNGCKNGNVEPNRNQTRYKYSPVHQDVAVCCVPNSMRITPYFLQKSWMIDSESNSLVCNLLAPSQLKTRMDNTDIEIETETNYPFENKFVFRVNSEKEISIKLRVPSWAISMECANNYCIDGQYVVFKCDKGVSTITMSFNAEPRVIKDRKGGHYFAYGSFIYALPIKAIEKKGREYYNGFSDYYYTAETFDKYYYDESNQPIYKNGAILVKLINQRTGNKERVKLVPVKETILRQMSF